jgi:hypothetical protein
MKGKAKILIFCTIFVGGSAFCQQKGKIAGTFKPANADSWWYCYGAKFQQYYKPEKKDPVCGDKILPAFSLLPANYYSSGLAFFCKQEIKFENVTKIPFKFRLGSVQQCDWMEGKPNSFYTKQ